MKRSASAAPRLLRGGPELNAWVLAGGHSSAAPVGWRLQLRWQAWWFASLSARQRQLDIPARPRQDPLFILGLWRSGTTLLHEWLAALPSHASPATWQCFSPSSFLLTGAPAGLDRGVQRPMDDGSISPGSPQEDEFAILLQGGPSLYRGFIDPRRLPALSAELATSSASAAAWVAEWLRFLAGVETQAGGARLVLKSPNHSLRVELLASSFPGANFVWIGRTAAEIWHSNLKMWQAMFSTYALWPCPPGALETFLSDCIRTYMGKLSWAMGNLPAKQVQWVDFAELYAEPEPMLGRLLRLLPAQQQAAQDPALLRAIVQSHPVRPAGTQSLTPQDPGVARLLAELDDLQAAARQCWSLRT